jgi:hypothetical protein
VKESEIFLNFDIMELVILVLFNVDDVFFIFSVRTEIACMTGSFDGFDKYFH